MNSSLTKDQKGFLVRHGLSPFAVFDATGMSKTEYRDAMKLEEKLFAMGTTPCRASGHTLRDRSGHCIECSPKNIRFIQRYFEEAHVYVAASSSLRRLKIGCSKDIADRTRTINGFAYGGATDWKMVASVKCKDAGRVEFAAHTALARHASEGHYRANGRDTTCRELFSCAYAVSREALFDCLSPEEKTRFKEVPNAVEHFGFS